MAEKNTENRQATEQRSAQTHDQPRGAQTQDQPGEAARAADGGSAPAYDLMSLDELRTAASERGVGVPEDVERAHLVSALRASDTNR
jgi:hypothetical protein